jgi:hypothetical protein
MGDVIRPDSFRDPYLGHSVIDGVPQYFSVSALENADTRPGRGGCLRRWWYRRVGGKADVEKASHAEAKLAGEILHGEISE